MNLKCAICGEEHDVADFSWHFREPLPWLLASETEREHSAMTEEQCELVTHEGMHFFVHALLHIPIKGSDEVFTWGVWCSLRERTEVVRLPISPLVAAEVVAQISPMFAQRWELGNLTTPELPT